MNVCSGLGRFVLVFPLFFLLCSPTHADWRNGRDSTSGDTGNPADSDVWSGYVRQPDGTYRWGGRSYSSNSAYDGGCGCSPDRSGGHADAAGF